VPYGYALLAEDGKGKLLFDRLTFGPLESLTELDHLVNILGAKCLLNDYNIALNSSVIKWGKEKLYTCLFFVRVAQFNNSLYAH